MIKGWATTLIVSCAVFGAGPVCAGGSGLEATAHCERAVGPGRVLCEVSVKPTAGRLVWSDVLVVRAPEFARPLRSRVAFVLGAAPTTAAAKLALVATQAGQGKLELLLRGVICQDAQAGAAQGCRAVAQPLSMALEVGPAVTAPATPVAP